MARPILTERERAQRNQRPIKPAVAAMFIYGREYSMQRGGSMDFWDALDKGRKQVCRDLVTDVEKARPEA